MQLTFNNQYENRMHQEFINLFHKLGLPLHFNHLGNRQFTNYQRVALIILHIRSKKSLRDFVEEFKESRWIAWLGLRKVPKKSTLHDWMKLFRMKSIRSLNALLRDKNIPLAAVDGTGIDSWQRSRHYEKRVAFEKMPYVKADLFVDVKTKKIIDFSIISHHAHDVKCAANIFKRTSLSGITILADGAYDSEPLHELVHDRGGILYAPVRKRNKRSNKKRPSGRFRRTCLELPDFMGQRSIVETVNSMIKRTQIPALRSKKSFMKKREFAWHVVLYNIKREINLDGFGETQSIIFLVIYFCSIPDRALFLNKDPQQDQTTKNPRII